MQAAIAAALKSLTGTPGWHIELVGGSRRQQRPADGSGGSVPPKQHHDAGGWLLRSWGRRRLLEGLDSPLHCYVWPPHPEPWPAFSQA